MFSLFSGMFSSADRDQPGMSSMKQDEKSSSSKDSNSSKVMGEIEQDVQIDNSSSVIAKIAKLYAERLMSDICLVVAGTDYAAHRLILCASSEVFQVMLMSPSWSESQESRVVLQETPACSKVFGDFLGYLYTGKIHINYSSVMPIVALADKYNVKDLIQLSLEYMCSHIVSAAKQNQLVSWLQYIITCGHHEVAQACQKFIKWNFELMSKTEDFGNFDLEVLVGLLQQSDIVIYDEMTLYNCIVKWLDYQREKLMYEDEDDLENHMELLVTEVMSYIRFPMMSPRQLAELLLSPLIKKNKEFFVERMAIGMSFHSGQYGRDMDVVVNQEYGSLLFTPRLYTAEKWSALLTVENFFNLPMYHTRTLMFSSPASCADIDGEKMCDWIVDIFPKGVWFRKFYLIVWQGTVEVPEAVFRTVRLSVMCKDPEEAHMKVGVLISGLQDGIEHIKMVVEKNFYFTEQEKILNFDDLLSFDDLNDPKGCSSYLVGPNTDMLKAHIIITPLSEFSYLNYKTPH